MYFAVEQTQRPSIMQQQQQQQVGNMFDNYHSMHILESRGRNSMETPILSSRLLQGDVGIEIGSPRERRNELRHIRKRIGDANILSRNETDRLDPAFTWDGETIDRSANIPPVIQEDCAESDDDSLAPEEKFENLENIFKNYLVIDDSLKFDGGVVNVSGGSETRRETTQMCGTLNGGLWKKQTGMQRDIKSSLQVTGNVNSKTKLQPLGSSRLKLSPLTSNDPN